MATHIPMARVPFAPLDNPRLQHLASLKNRQSGILAQQSGTQLGKAGITKSVLPPKRSYDSVKFNDFDSENVDPDSLSSPSKKSKSSAWGAPPALKGIKSSLTSSVSAPSLLSTPSTRSKLTSPRSPLTAPAGRSPKRKLAGARRISAPFSRIDPPSSLSARGGTTLPFSLDAALHGTFSSSSPTAGPASGATIQESMPSGWFFEIYEDSPEEVAANLMEHSTATLDLSSDEESTQKERNDRGKENTPPEDYDAPTASRSPADPAAAAVGAPRQVRKTDLIRKKVLAGDAMDDGQRSPLSDLEAEYFIPAGLDKTSHFVVDAAAAEKPTTKIDLNDLFATPVPFVAGSTEDASPAQVDSLLVVNDMGNVSGEIIVWQDDASTNGEASTSEQDVSADDRMVDGEKENFTV